MTNTQIECPSYLKSLVPLSRVVRASIVDTYEDIGNVEERYSHWAARGLRKLLGETLRVAPRKVLLKVNKNFFTANLPPDFRIETFVGIINKKGRKESLVPAYDLVDTLGVVDIPCEDKCAKCAQPKSVCEDLEITESTNVVMINGTPYDETVVRRLYPNGNYSLETTTPVFNTQTSAVEYLTTSKLITNLDLKSCGCLESTKKNIEKVKRYCGDVYCDYFAGCSPCSQKYGSYKVFEEEGRIQFDQGFPFDEVYLEYYGFMHKIKGDYYVPQVAFETLVEWTKWKSIANKRGVPRWERNDGFAHYQRERGNMEKELGKISLSIIFAATGLNPKFD